MQQDASERGYCTQKLDFALPKPFVARILQFVEMAQIGIVILYHFI